MNRRICNSENRRYVSIREFADYLGVGTTSARRAAKEIGAERKIGKRCVYDINSLDAYFEKESAITLPFHDED